MHRLCVDTFEFIPQLPNTKPDNYNLQKLENPSVFSCMKSLENYTCLCGVTRYLLVDLRNHISKQNLEVLPRVFQYQHYKCTTCDFSSFSRLLWLKHSLKGCLMYRCNECAFKTFRMSYLLSHKKRQHSSDVGKIRCDYCPFKCRGSYGLEVHLLVKHTAPEQIRWFHCQLCSYRGKHGDYLRKHMVSMHKVRRLECDQCSFQASSKYCLKAHKLEEHTSRKNFRCALCPFSARWPIHLKRHEVEKHAAPETIQWFQCEQCAYKSKRKANLKQHVRAIHAAVEEWFECGQCEFRTKWKKNVKLHKEKAKHEEAGNI